MLRLAAFGVIPIIVPGGAPRFSCVVGWTRREDGMVILNYSILSREGGDSDCQSR